ncbi:MAG: gumD [Bacteroidetes bacterium]|nr:gumD [Bacteroidota bacterium]MBS1233633.1 gumD [Bacteroidota bacterium]
MEKREDGKVKSIKVNRRSQLAKYVFSDWLSAAVSWSLFYLFRKIYIEPLKFGYPIDIELDVRFFLGLSLIPFFWLFLYYLSGYYRDVFRKSRLSELWQTIGNTFLGVIILFFTLLLNDVISTYSNYYISFAALFTIHFVLTYIPRLMLTTRTTHRVHNGEIGFNTLLIGSNEKAVDAYLDIKNQAPRNGNKIIGFVNVNDKPRYMLEDHLPHMGSIDNVKAIIEENHIEEVIIAIESTEHDRINRIINKLIDTNVLIKAIPSMYDILTGRVRMSSILGTPLIQISHQLMPAWQENVKTAMDYIIASLSIIITSPLILFLMIGVKLSSKGPIFYSHERIGRYGKPFTIYKFRSMYLNAEKNGPELSSKNDDRITPFGRFMRKSRLDEIPNFFNVVKGEMSLVGPRPERKYFIDLIIKKNPHYIHLLKVKPGITSWGQVKYGYAENVDQMIDRLKYDLIYLDNMSVFVDLKILIYTILTIIKRSGI